MNEIQLASLAMGIILFALAVVEVVRGWSVADAARKVTKLHVSDATEPAKRPDGLQAQSASVAFKDSMDALAKLAAAIKDLDSSSRYFVLALAFIGVAAGVESVQAVADAVKAS